MGQKVHPIGFRVGIYRDWDSRWFARKSYGDQILEDLAIRKILNDVLDSAEISRVQIEKAGENVRLIIHSARPGFVIGKKGQGIESLRNKIAKKIGKKAIEISVQEVKTAEIDATLVAKSIAAQLVKRISFKKAMKRAGAAAMRAGAKGIKICCAGRLNGAEIAREEWVRLGSVPLHTLRSNIDYGFAEAKTTYGIIGVKVWICKGEFQRPK
ncbi:30S ribosomal protein S3 [Candidatus Dependentiae bacterium]|nr:30S ribosomal protein S3 [Candidatus Dependentiae bacterium]